MLDLASRYSTDPWPLVAKFARSLLLDWSPGDRAARAELLQRLLPQLLEKPQEVLDMLTQQVWVYLRPRDAEGQLEAWLQLAGAASPGSRPRALPAPSDQPPPFLRLLLLLSCSSSSSLSCSSSLLLLLFFFFLLFFLFFFSVDGRRLLWSRRVGGGWRQGITGKKGDWGEV